MNYANLNVIFATPGTPENTSSGTTTWQKGQPPPPWAYEYQYPVDCLRPCFVIPQFQTGFSGGIPITTAVTGGAPAWWNGPPVTYKVGIDQFFPALTATVVSGGTGFAVGDIVILPSSAQGPTPIGAGARLLVATAPAGVIGTVTVIDQLPNAATRCGGSYFTTQTGTIAMDSVLAATGGAGTGTGATFTLTFGAQGSQRVILTNQEFATLAYIKQVTDPNIMDPLFQDAWEAILGAYICMALTGDKILANMCIGLTNNKIAEARKADGNEGLTVNDVTPDFIRIRGVGYADWSGYSPNQSFDWGSFWSPF